MYMYTDTDTSYVVVALVIVLHMEVAKDNLPFPLLHLLSSIFSIVALLRLY